MSVIPILNLDDFYNGTTSNHLSLAKQFKSAYTEYGFSYIINHKIPHHTIDNIFKYSKLFFDLEQNEKIKLLQDSSFRGYLPLHGSTTTSSTLYIPTKKPNDNESLIFAQNSYPNNTLLESFPHGFNFIGNNKWPLIDNFQAIVSEYYSQVHLLAFDILKLFSLAIEEDFCKIARYFVNSTSFLRMLHYIKTEQHEFGFAPHTDVGLFTILAQDSNSGLQVKDKSQEIWIDVPPIPYSFVLNTGDMVKMLSNNLILSTPHRVIPSYHTDRFSIPFFFDPDINYPMIPFNQNINFKEFDSNHKTYGHYLFQRLNANYQTSLHNK